MQHESDLYENVQSGQEYVVPRRDSVDTHFGFCRRRRVVSGLKVTTGTSHKPRMRLDEVVADDGAVAALQVKSQLVPVQLTAVNDVPLDRIKAAVYIACASEYAFRNIG